MAKMKACPVCGQKVSIDRLEAHAKKVHPREKVDISLDEEEKKQVKEAQKSHKPSARPRGKWIALAALIVIIVVILALILAPRGLKVGDVPPDFTLNDLNSALWNLEAHKRDGKPILLEFMHPDCEYCKEAVGTSSSPGAMIPLYGTYASRVEFVSIAIRLDIESFRNPPTVETVNAFKAEHPSGWTYLVESSGTAVRDAYGITGTPTFYLIGKNGRIAYIQSGYSGDLVQMKLEIDKELSR